MGRGICSSEPVVSGYPSGNLSLKVFFFLLPAHEVKYCLLLLTNLHWVKKLIFISSKNYKNNLLIYIENIFTDKKRQKVEKRGSWRLNCPYYLGL